MSAGRVDIEIAAKGDLSKVAQSVDALNKSLGINAERENELAKIRASFMTAAEAEVVTVKKLAAAHQELAKAKETERRAEQVAANPWASTGRSDPAKMAEMYRRTLEQVPPAQEKVNRSAVNMGQAMLQGSRALQDMQYGLAGAVNNVEGLASAFGMGAGITGAATVAAVALQALGPHLLTLIDALIPLDDALGRTSAKLAQDAVEAGQAYMAAVDNAGKQTAAFEAQLKAEAQALDVVNGTLDRQVKLLEARAKIQIMMQDAQTAGRIEDIKAQGLPPAEEARRIAEERLRAQDERARTEEKARQDAMATKQRGYGNDLTTFAQADARFKTEKQKAEDAAKFTLNQTEIAKGRDRAAQIATEQANSDRRGAPDAEGDRRRREERDRIAADIATRERSNQDILNRNGGQSPTALPPEQLAALKQQAEALKAQFLASMKEIADLALQQQIQREEAAAKRTTDTNKIAKDFTGAQFPGTPVFNNPGAGEATGLPFVTPMLPNQLPPGNPFTGTPLEGGFGGLPPPNPNPFAGTPLEGGFQNLLAPVRQAAATVEGNPLSNLAAELGAPLDTIATAYANQAKEVATLKQRFKQVEERIKNTRQ